MGKRILKTVRITFGAKAGGYTLDDTSIEFHVGLPELGEEPSELRFDGSFAIIAAIEATLVVATDSGGVLFGFLCGDPAASLSEQSKSLYGNLFKMLGHHHLIRIWNIVPRIHDIEAGEPRYWAFNRTRQEAFKRHFGEAAWHSKLPAASGVGGDATQPACLFFIATSDPPRYYENPRQIPAYRYPDQHGPAAPAFARAAAGSNRGSTPPAIFISGTAAVVGHKSVGSNELDTQLETTRKNLAALSDALGFEGFLQPAGPTHRIFVVYIRRPEHLARVRSYLKEHLAADGDGTIFLLADICRPELEVEIEATLLPANFNTSGNLNLNPPIIPIP